MNKVNFDSFKRIHASEELIEKALAIPATAEKAPAVIPWYRQSRAFAAAASIVLVVLAGFSVYFLFGNKKPPVASVERAVDPTTAPSENVIVPTGEALTELIPTESVEPTASTGQGKSSDRLTATESTQTIVGGAPQVTVDQPEVVIPADESGTDPAPPDQNSMEQPADPSQPPVEPPIRQSVITPTVMPTYPIEPQEPTEAPQPTSVPQKNDLAPVGLMIPLSSYNGSEDIYCRLSNSEGRVLGSPDLFDESHRVYFTTGSGYLLLSYPLNAVNEPIPAGNYTMIFYDADGNDFYISSVYLSSGSR